MRNKRKNRIASRWISLLAVLALCTTPLVCAADEISDAPADDTIGTTTESTENEDGQLAVDKVGKRNPFMAEVLGESTYTKGGDTVVLLPEDVVATGEATFQTGLYGDERNALVSDDAAGDLSWTFTLETAGWYVLRFDYAVLGDSGSAAQRGLLIDGKSPYFETDSVAFTRLFKDEGEVKTNNVGDQVRPSVVEVKTWQNTLLYDASGYYSTPLIFVLEAGEHTVGLTHISQDLAISAVTVEPYVPVESYQEVVSQYPTANEAEGLLTFQAENHVSLKSDSTIRIESNGDPSTEPSSNGYRVFNSVGGNAWRAGNQTINFSFEVPKTGYYKIALRVMQNWNDGLPSYRRVMIDGETPFSELLEVRFDYSTNWQTVVLGDGEEEFYFYLEAGKTHTLSMAVTMGPVREIVQTMYDDMTLLSEMMLEISKLTGNDPDPNYDYKFFRYIPDLEGNFNKLRDDLQKQYDTMNTISGKSTSMGSSVVSILRQIEAMIEDPFTIAKRYNQLEQAQTNLGQWYLDMQKMPLLIDEFNVAAKDVSVPARKSNFWQKMVSTWQNFLISFIKDYNSVGGMLEGDVQIKDSITVWISRGTEWAEAIQEMADEGYTPQSGVAVNMNVIPAGQLSTGSANMLMLSVTSGTSPDVVLGMGATSPVEFAIRDSAVDLTQFSDYEEVASRFLPQVFTPLTYKGGVYALPETMLFTSLFYRTDVISKYNITIPETREELYDVTLPQLFENGLTYYQPNDYTQFLYQNGGSYYTEDGYYSALDSDEAYRAFRELTEMFTHYSMPVAANFFNRFRTGEMPIGVGSSALYIQLSTAAPELIGKWEMAPLPGVRKENGDVDRTTNGNLSEVDMLIAQESDKKYQYCWDFLKWWSSKDVQLSFARDIEARVGIEARWTTANIEAFLELDWDKNDVRVIKEQWRWVREVPVVLGSAYAGRHITNAFTNVVVASTMTVRDALEKAVVEINRELRTKQEEYGVFVSELEEGK